MNFYRSLFLIWFFVFGLIDGASADFTKTNLLNYYMTFKEGGGAGATFLPPGHDRPSGIILYTTLDSVPAQAFHPSRLKASRSQSCFIEYDASSRTYKSIKFPGQKSFSIKGNITIKMGDVIEASFNQIDGSSGSMAYFSIIDKTNSRNVLAGLETNVMFNGSGVRPQIYLNGRPRSLSESEILEVKDNDLYLQGVPFPDSVVGLPSQETQANICLNKDVAIIPHSQYVELMKGTVSPSLQGQVRAIKHDGKGTMVLEKYTILNVLPEAVVVVGGYGNLEVLLQQSQRYGEVPICTLSGLNAP